MRQRPDWPPLGWYPPQRPSTPARVGRAVATGAGRVAAAGGRRAYARRRPLAPLGASLLAHIVGLVLWLGPSRYAGTLDLAIAIAVAPVAWRARRWPVWRRAYLAAAAAAVLAYLPTAAYWTPGRPVLWVSLTVTVVLWAWLWAAYYRVRPAAVSEDVEDTDAPQDVWADHVGGERGILPGSQLFGVHPIDAGRGAR